MFHRRLLSLVLPPAILIACSGSSTDGGQQATGGAVQLLGGAASTGGGSATGGVAASGGGTWSGGSSVGATKADGGANTGGERTAVGGSTTGGAGTGGTRRTGGSAALGGSKAASGGNPSGGASTGGLASGGSSTSGGSVSGGTGTGGLSRSGGASAGGASSGACASPTVRITEVELGASVVTNETEATTSGTNLMVLALAPVPSGGSRLMWHGSDGAIHVTKLNADDTVDTSTPTVTILGKDSGDIYADDDGGVLLVTRDAQGSGSTHCGNVNNLCGATSSLPTTFPCYDMYLVRFDGAEETWATKLTVSTADDPPYLRSPTDSKWVEFIWWYAHHGRIVSDGTNYAAYFGSAVSVSQSCVDANSALKTGVNIHQGDRMQVVSPTGSLLTGHNSFDWGCSHSGYERIVWDPAANKFAMVCKNDAPTGGKSGKLALPPNAAVIVPIDNAYCNVGNIVLGGNGGYWLTASDIRSGQTAGANGLADVHLFHFTNGAPDADKILASTTGANDRAPHLATYGGHLLAAWEEGTATGDFAFKSTGRTLFLQVLDSSSGDAVSSPIPVSSSGSNAIFGNRYQEFKPYPDGSVAYPSAGSTATKAKILRVMPCQ